MINAIDATPRSEAQSGAVRRGPNFDLRPVRRIEPVGPALWRIVLDAPAVAGAARPGQFLMVRPAAERFDPLLPRPFSIHLADPGTGTVEVVFKALGVGTERLSRTNPGERVSVLGPLGAPFITTPDDATPLLVAGGVGVPPIHFLALTLAAEGRRPEVFIGARSSKELIGPASFESSGIRTATATDDGSHGFKGLVTALLEGRLEKADGPVALYACGPRPMLRETARLAELHDVPCQVSLEAHMACGMGVCLGCVVRVGEEKNGYARVCREGPVFDGRAVDWENLP